MLLPHESRLTIEVETCRHSFCVYGHFLKNLPTVCPSNEIFFVGICKLTDVYKFPDAYRNNYWRDNVSENTIIEILVSFTSENLIECQRQLEVIVKQSRPIANIKGYRQHGKTMVTCIQGSNVGKVYNTTTEAAELNGVSQPAMSNHLNGRPGYETLRGMKFKRGL
jgi:hypothetical protein